MNIVFDSYAVLSYLQGESGMTRVQSVLEEADSGQTQVYLSLINLGEIAYIIERSRGIEAAQKTLSALRQMPLEIIPVTEKQVLAAAHIKARYPLSYADAFVVATAQALNAVLLTGDPEFIVVEQLVSVEMLL